MSVQAWMQAQLQQAGYDLLGEIETLRDTASSALVLTAKTNQGIVYCKRPIRFSHFEAGLTAQLAAWFPDYLPRLIAIDSSENYLLLADAGQTVRDLTQADGEFSRWKIILQHYVEIQKASMSQIDTLLDLAVPDRRLEQLPRLYDELLQNDLDFLMATEADSTIASANAQAIRAFAPQVQKLCDDLAAYGLAPALNHDDFHVNNVMFKDGQYRIIDWGEASISHPFYSLMLILRYAKFVFNADETLLQDLGDSYLSLWTEFAPLEELRHAACLAAQVAAFSRTLTWLGVAKDAPVSERAELAEAAAYWLLTFVNNTPFE